MASIEQVQAGIDFVEAHLTEEFSIADVAAAAGMSQWHFQRVFKALTHETLKTYIRSRRMAGALVRLLDSDERIIEIALLAGYDSQEAFARAFRQAFGMSPGQYRKIGQRNQFWKRVRLTPQYLESLRTHISITPEMRELPEMNLVGLATEYFGEGSEKNNVASRIPALWAAFLPRMGEIRGRSLEMAYGVIAQTPDEDRLIYTAAREVPLEVSDTIPLGMSQVIVPGAEYAVFEHRGPVRLLDDTVSFIYSNWLLSSNRRHSGGPDLELYGARYHPTSEDSVIHYAVPLS